MTRLGTVIAILGLTLALVAGVTCALHMRDADVGSVRR